MSAWFSARHCEFVILDNGVIRITFLTRAEAGRRMRMATAMRRVERRARRHG